MARNEEIGALAFKVGVIVAILSGIITALVPAFGGWVPLILLVAGIIVGVMNINDKETHGFLVASIALMVTQGASGAFGNIPAIGLYLVEILQNLAAFVAPAAIIVALKAVNSMAERH